MYLCNRLPIGKPVRDCQSYLKHMSVMIEIKFGKRNILAGVVILTSMNTYISLLLFSRGKKFFRRSFSFLTPNCIWSYKMKVCFVLLYFLKLNILLNFQGRIVKQWFKFFLNLDSKLCRRTISSYVYVCIIFLWLNSNSSRVIFLW